MEAQRHMTIVAFRRTHTPVKVEQYSAKAESAKNIVQSFCHWSMVAFLETAFVAKFDQT